MPTPDRAQPMGDHPTAMKPAPLENRIEGNANAVDVAAAVVTLWQEINAAMRPIIGQHGVIALFNRSVQLTAVAHPWLLGVRQESDSELQFSVIADRFSQQDAATAKSGGDALLLAFHQLLSALIGASLTERLLRSAFSPDTGVSPTQDASP
jgi:hypothetical protein